MTADTRQKFYALVVPHLERLYRVACRLEGNAADAQDLVQDTCLAACEKLAELEATTYPVRWLLRVQQNRFIDGVRRRRSSPVVAMDLSVHCANFPGTAPGPEELAEQTQYHHLLLSAFQRLDKTQRALLSLRVEGYGLAEIEAITGVSKEVLRARLQRARESFAKRVEEASAPPRVSRIEGGT
jgi:RNA polymerase sigma-70 factor (ECF subfamily)